MIAPRQMAAYWFWIGLGLCGFVLFMAIKPAGAAPAPFPLYDKLMHASVFAVLGSWFAALQSSARRWPIIALGLLAFGVAIELLQAVTGRDPSVWDVVADIIGIAVGILLLRMITAPALRYIEDRVRTASD